MLEDILIALIGVECLLMYFTEERMISKNFRNCILIPLNLVFGATMIMYVANYK